MKGSQGGTAAWGLSLDSPVRAQPLARVHGHALALVPELVLALRTRRDSVHRLLAEQPFARNEMNMSISCE